MGYKQWFYSRSGINAGNLPSNTDNMTRSQDVTGGYRPRQPSQRFGFFANQPPRVDNMNQPWYGNNDRSWGRGPGDTQTFTPGITDSSGDVKVNLKSFWGVLNSFFGGQTAKSNLKDQSTVYGAGDQIADPASLGQNSNNFYGR